MLGGGLTYSCAVVLHHRQTKKPRPTTVPIQYTMNCHAGGIGMHKGGSHLTAKCATTQPPNLSLEISYTFWYF